MKARLSFIMAATLSCAAPVAARRALTPPAPEFPAQALWLNSTPFSLAQLHERRVVLLAFINTANINSLRALKALEAWDRAWSLKGLMVIGVHTPSFTFQRDASTLKKVLRAYGVEFPVVMDNDRALWKAYANDGWPAFYLIDGEGRIAYDHLGEDRYAELEAEIRQAVGGLADYRAPRDPPLVKDALLSGCGESTPEVSLEKEDAAKPEAKRQASDRLVLNDREGEVEKAGDWFSGPDGPGLSGSNRDMSTFVRVYYRGAQALALLNPGGREHAKFFVRQDQLWLHPLNMGSDIRVDGEGRSYVVADAPRLYELAQNPNDNAHELEVIPESRGAAVHGFSFANRCLLLSR